VCAGVTVLVCACFCFDITTYMLLVTVSCVGFFRVHVAGTV
jgi:hypothetical protein